MYRAQIAGDPADLHVVWAGADQTDQITVGVRPGLGMAVRPHHTQRGERRILLVQPVVPHPPRPLWDTGSKGSNRPASRAAELISHNAAARPHAHRRTRLSTDSGNTWWARDNASANRTHASMCSAVLTEAAQPRWRPHADPAVTDVGPAGQGEGTDTAGSGWMGTPAGNRLPDRQPLACSLDTCPT